MQKLKKKNEKLKNVCRSISNIHLISEIWAFEIMAHSLTEKVQPLIQECERWSPWGGEEAMSAPR